MSNNNVFVKINYEMSDNRSNVICNTMVNCNTKAKGSKYLIGGGFYSKEKGCFVFAARDLKEAAIIANNNPLTKKFA